MGSPYRVEYKSLQLVLDSTMSLILRCTRPTEGSSMACIDVPDLLIFLLSARLRTMLKDPKQLTSPVEIRREKRVVLELSLHSDFRPIGDWGWGGIQLPQTGSVKSGQHRVLGNLLRLSTQVLGCSSGAPNVQPCPNCWGRERQAIDSNVCPSNPQPYMIDFKAENPITALSAHLEGSCLKADVTFHFTCYSRHHGGAYRQATLPASCFYLLLTQSID